MSYPDIVKKINKLVFIIIDLDLYDLLIVYVDFIEYVLWHVLDY